MRKQSRHINPGAEAGGSATDYELIARAQAKGSDGKPTADAVAARNMLILRHEYFIWNTVRKTVCGRDRITGPMLKQKSDDRFADGVYAFIRAVEAFDLSTGNSLTTYAFRSIWSHVVRATSLDTPVTRPAWHSRSKFDAMAAAEQYDNAGRSRRLHRASDGSPIDPAYLTQHARQASHVEDLLGRMDDETDHAVMLRAFREVLTERETDVLIRRFMREEPLWQIGERYGMCRERVRQIEAASVEKVQAWLMEQGHLVGRGPGGPPKTRRARRRRR